MRNKEDIMLRDLLVEEFQEKRDHMKKRSKEKYCERQKIKRLILVKGRNRLIMKLMTLLRFEGLSLVQGSN